MGTRILSWAQMCREADPDLDRRPWVYQFSNGRRFIEAAFIYQSPYIMDDTGTVITDDSGNLIRGDS